MCGILITKSNDDRIINSISHRGLEYGIKESQYGYNLVHHRLPIQTSDGDSWSQPYEIKKGIYLLFNGEIFNYDRIRFESDTEYLVDFFKLYCNSYDSNFENICISGIPYISKWDGFWAIVLYDDNTGEIVAFTDPLGKKQLYINEEGEVSSELKPLIKYDIGDPSHPNKILDPTFFGAIHKWGYNHDDRTPFLNIKRLLPNIIYKWKVGQHQIKQTFANYFNFYDCPEIPAQYPEEDLHNRLKEIMWESVENRLISKDYPISFLLSGGLDSAIIGGILVRMEADVNWYTIENDEDEYVKICEKEWGINVTRLKYDVDLKDEAVIEDLKEIYCKWNETPIDLGSVVPQYNLFKAVKEQSGHRIVISGDGADELFGGYRRIDQYDSQGSDVLQELTYYHLPRLDRMSMAHTIELRNPFLNHELVKFAMSLPFELRKNKKVLKDCFAGIVPQEIIERKKAPLKNEHIKKEEYEKEIKT